MPLSESTSGPFSVTIDTFQKLAGTLSAGRGQLSLPEVTLIPSGPAAPLMLRGVPSSSEAREQ